MADIMEIMGTALSSYLEAETSPQVQALKLQLLQRMVDESDVKPTRIPAPMNITEIGGYYNLLEQTTRDQEKLQEERIRMQLALIASALGLPT